MIIILLNFTIAVLAGLSILIILKNYKSNSKFNIYFLLILINLFVWRFLFSMFNFDIIKFNPQSSGYAFGLFMWPIYLLFFERLLNKNSKQIKKLVHFFICLIIIILFVFDFINQLVKTLVLISYTLTYFIFLIYLVINSHNNITSEKKIFLYLMLLIAVYIGVFANISLLRSNNDNFIMLKILFDYSAIVWGFILCYVFIKPDLLYGETSLIQTINKLKIDNFSAWSVNAKSKIQSIDKKVSDKVEPHLNAIILKIEKTGKEHYDISNTNVELTFEILKNNLQIPTTHLDYIFKYYCRYSKNDFFNYCKIKYAVDLLNNNYLSKNTIETLVHKCHFKSKSSFYNSFKKFTGKNPLEIYSSLKT